MGKILIVFEDEPQIEVLKVFINRISSQNPSIHPKKARNKGEILRKYPKWLDGFQNEKIDKALIIVDQDDDCTKDIVERLKNRISDRNYPFVVKVHVIERELETWLLADEKAISQVIDNVINRIKGDLETMRDPKEKLMKILSKNRKAYTAKMAHRIADLADVKVIASRCSGFSRFCQSVLDC